MYNATQNYTQNIDALENKAGIQNFLQCHGSFATATCMQCHVTIDGSHIAAAIASKTLPICTICSVSSKKKRRAKKRNNRRKRNPWDYSDSEPDEPVIPLNVMKVAQFYFLGCILINHYQLA
jgi:NAD-dependent SIR2 family protein deacetylase